MSESKWVLLHTSDGSRGEAGKQKIYEVVVSGTTVVFSWGMAEKSSRQSKTQTFYSPAAARQAAVEQVWAKRHKGYRLAYAV